MERPPRTPNLALLLREGSENTGSAEERGGEGIVVDLGFAGKMKGAREDWQC